MDVKKKFFGIVVRGECIVVVMVARWLMAIIVVELGFAWAPRRDHLMALGTRVAFVICAMSCPLYWLE